MASSFVQPSGSGFIVLSMAVRFACASALLLILLGTSAWAQAAVSGEDRLEALYSEAKAAETAGDLDGAVAKYQQMLKLDPHVGPAYNNIGALYFKQARYSDAAAILERGLKVDPKMTSASALLGLSLFQM